MLASYPTALVLFKMARSYKLSHLSTWRPLCARRSPCFSRVELYYNNSYVLEEATPTLRDLIFICQLPFSIARQHAHVFKRLQSGSWISSVCLKSGHLTLVLTWDLIWDKRYLCKDLRCFRIIIELRKHLTLTSNCRDPAALNTSCRYKRQPLPD